MSKYHRGDKFIIEIAEKHTHYNDRDEPYALYRVKGFKTLVLDEYALDTLNQMEKHKQKISNNDYHNTQDVKFEKHSHSARLSVATKYQIALNKIKKFVMGDGEFIYDYVAETSLELLQELINEYEKLEKIHHYETTGLISEVENDNR